MPQAMIWEADRIFDQVAMYVRVYVEAMQPGAPSTTRTLAKQLQNELLLTVPSMLSARYVVKGTSESDSIAAAMAGSVPGTTHVSHLPGPSGQKSAKSRFTVVPAGPDPSAVAASEDDEDEETDVVDDDPDEEIPF